MKKQLFTIACLLFSLTILAQEANKKIYAFYKIRGWYLDLRYLLCEPGSGSAG